MMSPVLFQLTQTIEPYRVCNQILEQQSMVQHFSLPQYQKRL